MHPFSAADSNNSSTNKLKLDDSTGFDQTLERLDGLSSRIFDFCESKHQLIPSLSVSNCIKSVLRNFVSMTPNEFDLASEQFKKFTSSCIPEALVMLYMTQDCANIAYECICEFIDSLKSESLTPIYAFIVLDFCNILEENVDHDDGLYVFCRSSLGAMIKSVGIVTCNDDTKKLLSLNDIFQYVIEITGELCTDLGKTAGSTEYSGLSFLLVRDFTAYIVPVCNALRLQVPLIDGDSDEAEHYRGTIEKMKSDIFDVLLEKMVLSLRLLGSKGEVEDMQDVSWWSLYLVILKHLYDISKLCNNLENKFWKMMRQVKSSLCFLIFSFATESEDYEWLFEHKEVTDFDARSHLAWLMLPKVGEDEEDRYNLIIDRSELLEDSFDCIGIIAKPEQLLGGLFIEFKHEQATGSGVLREWFSLVCQEIFNPQNALFVACPNDHRRFFPNQASKVNPVQLEYFRFSGRMIALALMHNVQIGVVFDHTFYLQLAGKDISLEDIRDTDPFLYNSYKHILDMDAKMVDEDVLGLTFVSEVDSLGSRKEIELCSNGKDTVVDSKNRETYVNLLIKHRFVTSIAEQVAHFAKGFEDLIFPSRVQSFFRCLNLDDLDLMLGGKSDISVEDWKAHTDYTGYEESDDQIAWFWEIVECMPVEQRKVLLFFWTSIKSLPLKGFGGLDSRLHIYKNSVSCDHLPSSQTCFYRIYFPPYQSKFVMQDRLCIITQEHVGCSFGTS